MNEHSEVMTPSNVARSAIMLMERGWTKVEPAVDAEGKMTPCWGPKAVAWTIAGAIGAVRCPDKSRLSLLGKFLVMNDATVHEYNRDHGREECVEALRRCVEN